MTLSERHQLSVDPAFIARVQIAATQVAIDILTTPDPDSTHAAAARRYLRENTFYASRLATMAAAVVESADVSDHTLSTLITNAWSFLATTLG